MDSTEDQIQDPLNFTTPTAGPAHRPGFFIRMFEVRDHGFVDSLELSSVSQRLREQTRRSLKQAKAKFNGGLR
jgi:hypothetical protein